MIQSQKYIFSQLQGKREPYPEQYCIQVFLAHRCQRKRHREELAFPRRIRARDADAFDRELAVDPVG